MTNAEAIETLKANYPDACFEQLREAVDAAIEALKAPTTVDAIEELRRRCEQFQYMPLPAWIPVTERLPEIKEHHISDVVLVCLDDGGMAFSELEENIFGQVWFSVERPSPYGESDCTVTHWMPLPEPPKGERKDDESNLPD